MKGQKYLVVVIQFLILFESIFCYNHHGRIMPRESFPDFGLSQRSRAFSRRSHVDYDSSESSDHDSNPFSNFVDFDELHPGEDMIAMESSNDDYQPQETLYSPPRAISFPATVPQRPILIPIQLHPRPLQEISRNPHFQDRLLSFITNGPLHLNQPWWRKANVCTNKEEIFSNGTSTNTNSNNSNDASVNSQRSMSQLQTLFNTNTESNDGGFVPFEMRFSSCEEHDEKYSCITRDFGPNKEVIKTIKIDYECCDTYALDQSKTQCERANVDSISKTVEKNGVEFMKLCKSVGVDRKLEMENLTVFLASDEGVKAYLSSISNANHIDSNSVTVSLQQEYRRRRHLFRHNSRQPMDAYGLDVRRHNENRGDQEQWSPTEEVHHINDDDDDDDDDEKEYDYNDWRSATTTPYTTTTTTTTQSPQQNYNSQSDNRIPDDRYRYSETANNGDLQNTLLTHIYQKKLSTDDFVDEKVIFSENSESSIRLNTWNVDDADGSRKSLKTVNCAPLKKINIKCAKSGMIHVIDRVLTPVTKSITQIISSHPDLSIFNSIAGPILPVIQNQDGHYTVFAPSNSAFEQLDRSLLEKLRRREPCAERILRRHVLPITFCTCVIRTKGQVRNIDHKLMDLERDGQDRLFINGSQIISKELMSTNGVVFIIDKVLTNEADLPVPTVLENRGLSSFINACSQVGIKDMLETMTNATVFAPSDTAMAQIPDEIMQNSQRLRDILMFHITIPEIQTCYFRNNQMMTTKLTEKSMRVNIYSSFFRPAPTITVQCAPIKQTNIPTCNGVIHTLDKVLLPPENSIVDTLKRHTEYSIFNRILSEVNLTELQGPGPFTIFSPTDEAFKSAMSSSQIDSLFNDREKMRQILRNHIIQDSLCCAGISSSIMRMKVVTLSGLGVEIDRDRSGQAKFGSSKIITCDLMATNGIIHGISEVIMGRRNSECKNGNVNILGRFFDEEFDNRRQRSMPRHF